MNTATKYFGDISYEQQDVLHIPGGLFGFENRQEFLLIHFRENDGALLCLQSLDDWNLAFILVNPFYIMSNYQPEVSEDDKKMLQLSEDSQVSFYSICVIHDKLENSTVNLRCPLVINTELRVARQVILEDTSLSFKHPLKQTAIVNKKGEATC